MTAVTPINQPNSTQYFYPADDKWEYREFPFKASTAIWIWTLVWPEISANDVTGNLSILTWVENVNGWDFMWIMAQEIKSTDPDYATAWKLKWVWVPTTVLAEAYFTVWAGTFTTGDVFRTVEIHSDKKTLAVDTKGKWARIMGYINSTRWRCRFSLPETETA